MWLQTPYKHSVLKFLPDTPEQWITNVIVPLPKKGDLSLMTNYRGISLMSIAAKVYNKILSMRIRDHIDHVLRKNQAEFLPGRSCSEQIHILRRLIEAFGSYQLPLTITFIDFKKAFDSVNRSVMFSILRHYGIPEVIVNAITVLNSNSKSAVMVGGNLFDLFEVTHLTLLLGFCRGRGVLAPFLFFMLIDYLTKRATEDTESGIVTHPRQSKRHPAKFFKRPGLCWLHWVAWVIYSKCTGATYQNSCCSRTSRLIISVPKTEYMTVAIVSHHWRYMDSK